MITSRDKQLFKWLEDYKAITISQAQYLLFGGCYESCRRRLKQLETNGILKSYFSNSTKEKVYYQDQVISDHNLYVYDYLKVLTKLGCEIVDVKIQPHYLKNSIVPDAYVSFKYNKCLYITLLEVDYTHYTTNTKLNTLYEKLYNERLDYQEFKGTFPIVIIARPTNGIRYNSRNFEIIYTDLEFNSLDKFLLV